jgi:hypothetical protein
VLSNASARAAVSSLSTTSVTLSLGLANGPATTNALTLVLYRSLFNGSGRESNGTARVAV